MEAFKTHRGIVYPLDRINVDTDQIIPKQFLKKIERTGFGKHLFHHWRYDEQGNLRSDFSLNEPKYAQASILVSGSNFGCGSSREHAPWAIKDYGFQAIIAPSFADIFFNNCLKNGILAIVLEEEKVNTLLKQSNSEKNELTIDLENQLIYNEQVEYTFHIDEYQKYVLLNGLDEIGITLQLEDKIADYESNTVVGR